MATCHGRGIKNVFYNKVVSWQYYQTEVFLLTCAQAHERTLTVFHCKSFYLEDVDPKVLRVSWLVRPAEILLLSYSSLALDFSFFVLGKHHLKHTIFLPSIDQIVPSIWSLNCSPTSELPDHVERYSRKVFVGGLPPDIDEG